MFPRRAGTYPNQRNEPIIIVIVSDNNRLLVHARCLPKIRFFPPISLVGDTSGGWCGKQVHVMMKLWGKMVKFWLQRGPSAHAEDNITLSILDAIIGLLPDFHAP